MGSNTIETVCPCCESKLKIDVKTGEVLWQEEKPKASVSLADMVKGLDAQQKEKEKLFQKSSASHKERDRVLDEKFKEAQKHVDKSSEKPLRDFDLD